METIRTMIQQFSIMKWQDYVDILLVAFLLYRIFPLIRSKTTMRIAAGIAAVFLIAWITDFAELHVLNFILTKMMTVGLLALVILFQPELRRMFDHIGSVGIDNLLTGRQDNSAMDPVIPQVVQACAAMSRERVGALIVFSRRHGLDEYFKTGTVVDAAVSEQLICNIFFPKAALHDGAVIIQNGRIAAAGCVLPLSDSKRLPADLGTRHRAGVGMSEATDAVVVIVSEETGAISVAVDGVLKRYLAPQTLERLLHTELGTDKDEEESTKVRLRQKLSWKGREEK